MAERTITQADLAAAQGGSFYTICGAGGDLTEWVEGYEKMLAEQEIGKPTEWFQTTGAAVNTFRRTTARGEEVHPRDAFQDDLTILLFPLDGLDVGRLAMFRLRMEDRWFDDVLANMRMIETVSE